MRLLRTFFKIAALAVAVVMSLSLFACENGAIDSDEQEGNEKNVYDLILFTGQSNMVGRETERYPVEIPEGMAYEYKASTNKLYPVRNPAGEPFGSLESSSGSSILPRFVEKYVETTGRKAIALHAGCGGSSVNRFVKGADVGNDIMKKVDACTTYLQENNYTIGRCFYLYFQGSTDVSMSSENYETLFLAFHTELKNHLDYEFGAQIFTGEDKDNLSQELIENVLRINGVKSQMAREHDDLIVCNKQAAVYFVENPEYMREDNLHYNTQGLLRIADDSVNVLLDYLGYGDPDKTGVDPETYLSEPVFTDFAK